MVGGGLGAGGGRWPMIGRDLIMWSEGQWEAWKKINLQTYTDMDIVTDRPTRPEGQVGENRCHHL